MPRSVCLSFSLFVACTVFTSMPAAVHGQDADAKATANQTKEDREKDFEKGEAGDGGSYIRKRQEWFHDQRAFPLKHIPAGIRQRAVKERNKKLAVELALKSRVSRSQAEHPLVAQPQWTLIGPQPVGNYYGVSSGRVAALAVDPTNAKIVYAGGAEGGVWKSTDGGSTWTPMTDDQPSLAVGSIALDPNNSSIVYVGTGEENFAIDNYYGAGVLKSTDGGVTWTQYCGPFCGPENVNGYSDPGAYIGGIAVDPSNSQIVLAATELYGAHGVYRSVNGGQTWTLASTDGGIATVVVFDPVNVGVAYAVSQTAGVIKSTNHGQTWVASNGTGTTVIPSPSGGRMALALAASNPLVVYVGLADPSTGQLTGFYKSTDGGTSWNQLTTITDYCGSQCWYDNVIGVSPVNPDVVFAGGQYAYSAGGSAALRSLDGGQTWSDQGSSLHPDAHAMAFSADGTILYTGNDGGVWSTAGPTAATVSWTSLNPNLAITEFYPGISIDPSNVNHTYDGTQDNGTNKYSGSLDWPTVDCGDGGATAIDFSTPTTVYTNCIGLSLDKSVNDGASFTSALNGIDTSDSTYWTPPLAMDPENSQTLYFGTYRVYQTTNAAGVWAAISPDLTDGGGDNLSTIAVAPTDSNTVYSGAFDSKLYVTRNALSGTSATWTDINSTTSLPSRSVVAIAVDPTTPLTAYVGYSGFTGFGDSLGHIFKTTDAGSTWTDISSDLPNTPVNSILIDPDSPDSIFIGTDIGTFYTSSSGASWSTLGTGLPNVVVTGLALHNASRTLRASTHGRSVWDLNISTLVPLPSVTSISPTGANLGSGQFTLTVNGVQFAQNSEVEWNGTPLTTTYVSATALTATVPASDLKAAGRASITVFNPTAGKLSNAATFTIDNVPPSLSSVSPTSVFAGGAAFTLTANGGGFVSGATVQWNGVARTTTFVSATQVTASISASDIAVAETAEVSVLNPAPGGGSSSTLPFVVDNPVPSLTSLSPASRTEGGAAFTLTLTGTNFVQGSAVQWNGSMLSTTFGSATQLTASVSAALVAHGGTATVTVVNPGPGGGTSQASVFTIDNPAPVITNLSPNTATAGGAALTLTVTGGNFVSGSTINWNGSAIATTFVSSTGLKAVVPATDISVAGTATVSVTDPAPGGGTSGADTFTVDNPVPKLTSLSPASIVEGSAAFKLTVVGTGFVSTSQIVWNSTTLATTLVDAEHVSATIPASDVATAGTASVYVKSPAPGGGSTAKSTFTVDSPVPVISALSPAAAIATVANVTLTVTGTGFVAASKIDWNGTALNTKYVSATQITAVISGTLVATAGTASITVVNPTPGGGTSAIVKYPINNPVPALSTLSPAAATAGSAAFTLKVAGTYFLTTSSVLWNGAAIASTYVSATQLNVSVPAADIQTAGTVKVSVTNPTPGGGTSTTSTFTINNPVPTVTSYSPTSAAVGGAAFTLSATGTNFVASSKVLWNGTALATTFVSATSLQAAVPASDLSLGAKAELSVTNPAPGGGSTPNFAFSIDNPVPAIASLSPSSAVAGSAAFTLTVNGTDFVPASQILFNSVALTTTYVSATKITASVPASDVATAGVVPVKVTNPAPGGGTAATTFTIGSGAAK